MITLLLLLITLKAPVTTSNGSKQLTGSPFGKVIESVSRGDSSKRRSILDHQQLSTTTPVSLHFNQAGHSIKDVRLIPIELIRSKRDSVRNPRDAHLISKAKTLHPFGINRRDEARVRCVTRLVTHLTLVYS